MPRSAPTVDGTAYTRRYVSFRFIDQSGDLRSVKLEGDPANITDANVEALAVELGANSHADLYSVEIVTAYESVPSTGNATFGEKSSSVFDNVVFMARAVGQPSQNLFLPAPIGALFVQDPLGNLTDNVDGSNLAIQTIGASHVNMLATGYTFSGLRYTERKEINTQTKF